MRNVPDHILVRSRWVLCNKGDAVATTLLHSALMMLSTGMKPSCKSLLKSKSVGVLEQGATGPKNCGSSTGWYPSQRKVSFMRPTPRHCDLLASSLNLSPPSSAATPGVKPADRDEHVIEDDEPDKLNLLDYSDPDQVIAARCRGTSSSAECEKHLPGKPAD